MTATFPPAPVLPVPTVNEMAPPAPPKASPVVTVYAPLAPTVEAPLAISIAPLTPAVPAFEVFIVSAPVLDDVLSPVVSVIAPPVAAPVAAVVFPALNESRPPSAVSPAPTLILISPPLPEVDSPVESVRLPDEWSLAVPDPNTTAPLAPATPALADSRIRLPLLVAVPTPLTRRMLPPVAFVPTPPEMLTLPPKEPDVASTAAVLEPPLSVNEPPCISASLVSPALRLIAPPLPIVPDPTLRVIAPPLPPTESPVVTLNSPVVP